MSLENDKKLIEKNMQLINWVAKDKAKHPFYREEMNKMKKKYKRKLKLKQPESTKS